MKDLPAKYKPLFALLFTAAAWIGIGMSYHSVYVLHFFIPFALFYVLSECTTSIAKNFFVLFWPLVLAMFSIHLLHVNYLEPALRHLIILSIGSVVALFFALFKPAFSEGSKLNKLLGTLILLEAAVGLVECSGLLRWPVSSISEVNVLLGYPNLIEKFSGDAGALLYLQKSPTGFHWNPNDFSLAMLIALPFLLVRKNTISNSIIVLSFLFLFVMAGARWIFLIAIMVFVAGFFIRVFNKKMLIFSLSSALLMSSNFLFLGPQKWIKFEEMKVSYYSKLGFEFDNLKEDNSGGTRIGLFFRALDMVKSSNGMGVGGGQAQVIIANEGGIGKHHDSSVHNFWLEWLAEGGAIAEILFVLYYLLLLRGTYLHSRKNKNDVIPLLLFIALIVFFLGSLSLSSCLYFLPMYLLFGIASGWLIHTNQLQSTLNSKK
ncbi:MAG: O-antigen ligase family protein [Flavobacteriales bacterium]